MCSCTLHACLQQLVAVVVDKQSPLWILSFRPTKKVSCFFCCMFYDYTRRHKKHVSLRCAVSPSASTRITVYNSCVTARSSILCWRLYSRHRNMANSEVKVYLTHDKMIVTNEHGFHFEFNIPVPGNIVMVHIGQGAFHICHYPPEPPRSPTISDVESDDPGPHFPAPNGGWGPNQN